MKSFGILLPLVLSFLVACATDTVQPIKGSLAEQRHSLIVTTHALKVEVQEVLERLLRVAGQRPRSVTLRIVRGGEDLAVANCALRELNISEESLNVARDKMAPADRRMMFANLLGHELGHILKGNCGQHPDTELEADRLAIEWSMQAGYGCAWLRNLRQALAEKRPESGGRFLSTWEIHPELNARAYEQAVRLCPAAPRPPATSSPSAASPVVCPKGAVWTGTGCIAEQFWNPSP